jgi:hypothetical protein
MSHLHIYQKVKTPDGNGIIININCPFNGLYYEPDRATCVVWYGVEDSQNGWAAQEYPYKKILELNNNRKEKIEEIFGNTIKMDSEKKE